MIERLLADRLDMVVGSRIDQEEAAYRAGHRTGNKMLTSFVAAVFGPTFKDMLSGYRVFSRRFVKSFPVLSGGFEIETELTIHALELGLPAAEIETPYYSRPVGSASKLNTWSDGFRILRTIVNLYRAERPLMFFSGIGLVLAIVSIALAIPVFVTFVETGLVPRLPTAILAMGLMMTAFLSISVGLVLDTVTRGRREMKLLAYLAQRAPGEERRRNVTCTNSFAPMTRFWSRRSAHCSTAPRSSTMVFDQNMSVLEGSLGILPRRVLVAEDDVACRPQAAHRRRARP